LNQPSRQIETTLKYLVEIRWFLFVERLSNASAERLLTVSSSYMVDFFISLKQKRPILEMALKSFNISKLDHQVPKS
jgi:hypothetical protein